MRLCRFDDDRLGLVEGDEVLDVTGALDVLPKVRWPAPQGDLLIEHLDEVLAAAVKLKAGAKRLKLTDVKLKSPVANPNKVIGAPVNYHLHIQESRADAGIHFGSDVKSIDHYGLFLKSPVLIGASDPVQLHFTDRRNDHEIELAIVIGKTCRNVAFDDALDYVAGYSIGLDMVVRGPEDRSQRKGIDTYSVLGPWLVTPDEIDDPDNLEFEIQVGEESRQKSNTNLLIFGCKKLIEYASAHYTLYPGDVIMTGTPEGVGPVVPGDTMHCRIEQVGEMDVAVEAAPGW